MLFAALLTAAALAAPPPGPPMGPPPPIVELAADAIDDLFLDAQTLAAARAVIDGARPELDALREEARDAHDALHEAERATMDALRAELGETAWSELAAQLPPPPRPPAEVTR